MGANGLSRISICSQLSRRDDALKLKDWLSSFRGVEGQPALPRRSATFPDDGVVGLLRFYRWLRCQMATATRAGKDPSPRPV
jgi:hypothetical protein